MSLTITKDRVAEFAAAARAFGKRRVYVGVPGETALRKDPEGKAEPINNAALAYIQNAGSALANIPARPFMEPGIKDAQPQIIQTFAEAVHVDKMTVAGLENSLKKAGIQAVVAIKKRIVSQEGFEPLAKSTIAARKRKGRNRTKALIDTSEMMNSIKSVVRDI